MMASALVVLNDILALGRLNTFRTSVYRLFSRLPWIPAA
jgi:hypothetical protein